MAVKKVELKSGGTRYEFAVMTGTRPDGRKIQERRRFATKREADREFAKIKNGVNEGTHVRRWDGTVGEIIDAYLSSSGVKNRTANTRSNYTIALKPARERLGSRQARSITREDVEALADWMAVSGRKRGGKVGSALSARSVRLTIGRLGAAFDLAVKDRKLAANPVKFVDLPESDTAEREAWSGAQVQTFLAVADADRLSACWRLSLYGLRRAEVTGLRWDEDIDLDGAALTVAETRVVVYDPDAAQGSRNKVIEKAPKSKRGGRTLPLDAATVAALRAMRAKQAAERLAAGAAYEPSGRVACNEIGQAVSPEWYSHEFGRLLSRAGLPRIVLHGARHTANSLMADAGVPAHIRAAFCGHTVAVNTSTYTHASDLSAARDALATAYGAQA
jgi:integrase